MAGGARFVWRSWRGGAFAGVVACLMGFAACGGESRRHEGTGAVGGTAGAPGAGGVGGSGTGCPAAPPRTFMDACPPGVPDAGCRYTLACGSGEREFVYHCGDRGWSVQEEACANPFESCTGGDAQVRCMGGSWQLLGAGGDGPGDCAVMPPVEASPCTYSIYSGPSQCGYPCPDSDRWTVATCVFPAGPSWLYDGSCAGHCGGFDQALFGYLSLHDECTVDEDCTTVMSTCSRFVEHCSGAIAVNGSIDPSTFAAYDDDVTACAADNADWSCIRCRALAPPPRCVNGYCSLSD